MVITGNYQSVHTILRPAFVFLLKYVELCMLFFLLFVYYLCIICGNLWLISGDWLVGVFERSNLW